MDKILALYSFYSDTAEYIAESWSSICHLLKSVVHQKKNFNKLSHSTTLFYVRISNYYVAQHMIHGNNVYCVRVTKCKIHKRITKIMLHSELAFFVRTVAKNRTKMGKIANFHLSLMCNILYLFVITESL